MHGPPTETTAITNTRTATVWATNAAALLIITIPAWWILGLDQAAWLGVGLAFTVVAASERSVPRGIVVGAVLFLAAVVTAGVLGATGSRWLTLAREVLVGAAFFGTIAGVASIQADRRLVAKVVMATAIFVTISAAATLFTVLVQNPFTFETPIAKYVPESISSTRLGELSFVVRTLGTVSYFVGDSSFIRPQGLFLFSTSEAVALAVSVPLLLAASMWWTRFRWALRAVALAAAVALLATTTRGPLAGLLGAAAVVWIARGWTVGYITVRLNRRTLPAIAVVLVGVVAAAFVLGLSEPASRLIGTRSLDSRTALYEATVDQWMERPLLGWGTEVDWFPSPTPEPEPIPTPEPVPYDPSVLPPLGSHSEYLGVLFKQGLVGLAIFLAIVVYVGVAARRLFRRNGPGDDWLVVGFLTAVISAITESLWLDPATAVLVAILWGVVVGSATTATRSLASSARARDGSHVESTG